MFTNVSVTISPTNDVMTALMSRLLNVFNSFLLEPYTIDVNLPLPIQLLNVHKSGYLLDKYFAIIIGCLGN